MIRLHRLGGRPPVDDELVEVADDGAVTVRRTIARAASPPCPVGRFGSRLDRAAVEQIRAEAAAAAAAGDVEQPLPAGAARDDLEVPGARAVGPAGASLPAGWSELATDLRSLLTGLADHPIAALEATVDSLTGIELRHLGSEPLDVDLSHLLVRASTWRDDLLVDAAESQAPGPRSVVVEPGWRYRVDVTLEAMPDGITRRIEVEGILLGDGQTWRVCSLEARRA